MEEDEENVLTEDLDVGENFNVDIKPDLPLYKHKDRYKKLRIPGPRNRCPYGCLKFLAPRTIDYHRTNGCRMSTEDPLGETSKKRNFCCGVCYAEFITRPGFLQHLKVEHDVDAEVHQVIFKDRAMFDRFVKWMEMEGGAHFRHKSGSKRRASGKGIFMACNRSGYVGGTGAAVDPVKNRTGPFRTGYSCTAFIHGSELPNGRVQVEMCGDHYGHDARMRLPNVVKQLVAQKQLEGEMPQDIVSYLKRQFSHFAHENIYAQRVCLVDHEELRSLMFSTTKKWEQSGIPTECELWEEELLDRAGILREGVPRLRPLTEPTTQQVAEREMWPRPRVFVAKMRTENGFVELPELCKATAEARRQSVVHNTDAFEEVAQHAQDPFRVSDIQPKKELPDEVEETGIEEDTSMNDSGGEIVVDDRGTPPPLVVRERQVRPSSAERRRSVNRQLVVSNIFSELEHIDRVVQVDGSSISDSSLISFLNRLRQARQGLTNSVNVRANTNGHRAGRLVTSPLLNSVVDRMQQANRGAAAHRRAQAGLQGAQSAERRPPRLMKTEILTLADIEDELSDDEQLVNSSGAVQYNASLWS